MSFVQSALSTMDLQRTVKVASLFEGVGLHSGVSVEMTVKPAPADHGISFVRTDISDKNNVIPASWDLVVPSSLCTLMKNDAGVEISTIEHIMSALSGLGIDNAMIEINGPEVPIMDGSSAPFVRGLMAAGIVMQHKARKLLRIIDRVEIEEDGKKASFVPSHVPVFTFGIEFEEKAIGRQDLTFEHIDDSAYIDMISEARTFALKKEVDYLLSQGLIKGGSLENAVVVDGANILNGSLRYPNEFVRHKILDAIGDVALSGHKIIGHFFSSKGGHALTNKLLRVLFETPSAYRIETVSDQMGSDKLQEKRRSVIA